MSWFQRTGRNAKKGFRVGIEVEVESDKALDIFHTDSDEFCGVDPRESGWTVDSDGSLRSGMEFISKPLKPKDFPEALGSLENLLDEADARANDRCSVHIHVNTTDLTSEQLECFIYLSTCIEPILMRYCSDMRNDNTYCLPTYKTSNLVRQRANVIRAVKNTSMEGALLRHTIVNASSKYAAISTYRLSDLGTVEFRMFDGTTDVALISQYLSIVQSIYEVSLSNDIVSLQDRKTHQGVLSLLCPTLTEILGSKVPVETAELIIERGVQMANDILMYKTLSEEELFQQHAILFPEHQIHQEPRVPDMTRLEAIKSYVNGGIDVGTFSLVVGDTKPDADLLATMIRYTDDDTAWAKLQEYVLSR